MSFNSGVQQNLVTELEENRLQRECLEEGLQEIQQTVLRHRYTPDLAVLSRREFHKVFIYDGLMKAHTHTQLTPNFGEFCCTALTSVPYELWKKNLKNLSYPIALPPQFDMVPSVPVKGEIWKVRYHRLIELDNGHENGVQFQRVRATVNIPIRRVLFLKERMEIHYRDPLKEPDFQSMVTSNERLNKTEQAWMYIGLPSYWKDQLDGGYHTSLVRRFNSEKAVEKQYYYFTPKEFTD